MFPSEYNVNVVVQFYFFLLFLSMVMYDNNMIMSLKQKKRNFEPRIKLNHNINMVVTSFSFPCPLKFGKSLQTSYRYVNFFFFRHLHFKRQKSVFWKATFAKQELIKRARLHAKNSATGKNFSFNQCHRGFFLRKVNL